MDSDDQWLPHKPRTIMRWCKKYVNVIAKQKVIGEKDLSPQDFCRNYFICKLIMFFWHAFLWFITKKYSKRYIRPFHFCIMLEKFKRIYRNSDMVVDICFVSINTNIHVCAQNY